MPVECFLDTNVVVYAAAGGRRERAKRVRALKLIDSYQFGLSAQVLQEFFVTVTRKAHVALSPETALEWIELLETFPVQPVDSGLVKVAIEVGERYQVSYWDAAILASAEALGAETVFSEDLGHGQRYGTVRVTNPFLDL